MKTQIALAGALALAAISIWLLIQQNSDRTRLEAELADARTTIEHLQKQINELSTTELSATDLARLRTDQRDAIRLRGEVTSLKHALAAAQQAVNKTRAGASNPQNEPGGELQIAPLPEDNPDVRVYKTRRISTQLASGHALLVGGWESRPGWRTFALIEPKRDSDGSDAISVATRWVDLSGEAAKRVHIGGYLDSSGGQSAILAQFAAEQLVKTFESEPGIDLLTAPTVKTIAGRQARISVTDSRETAGGSVDFGQQLDVLPTLSEDGQVNVILQASLVLPREP